MPGPPILVPGVAPPPVGPRLPNPQALDGLKNATRSLFDVVGQLAKIAELEPLLAKDVASVIGEHLNGGLEALTTIVKKSVQGPSSPRRAADGSGGPLDRTPSGVGADGGTPPVSLPQLMGLQR